MAYVLIHVSGIGILKLAEEVFREGLAAGKVWEQPNVPPSQPVSLPPEPLLDADQVAQLLSIPPSWIEQAAREKRIPCFQFGRWRRYRRSDIEAIMAARGVSGKLNSRK